MLLWEPSRLHFSKIAKKDPAVCLRPWTGPSFSFHIGKPPQLGFPLDPSPFTMHDPYQGFCSVSGVFFVQVSRMENVPEVRPKRTPGLTQLLLQNSAEFYGPKHWEEFADRPFSNSSQLPGPQPVPTRMLCYHHTGKLGCTDRPDLRLSQEKKLPNWFQVIHHPDTPIQTPCKPLSKWMKIKSGSGLNNLQYGVQSSAEKENQCRAAGSKLKALLVFLHQI